MPLTAGMGTGTPGRARSRRVAKSKSAGRSRTSGRSKVPKCESLSERPQPAILKRVIADALVRLRPNSKAERVAIEQNLILRFHFHGKCVAYITSPRDVWLVGAAAPGSVAYRRLIEKIHRLSETDRSRVVIEIPSPIFSDHDSFHSGIASRASLSTRKPVVLPSSGAPDFWSNSLLPSAVDT